MRKRMPLEINEIRSSEYNSELIPIPMSDINEKGLYFLKSHKTENDIETIEYIRTEGKSAVFSKMQIKRSSHEIRKQLTGNPEYLESMGFGSWHTPNEDFTDIDIFNFICKHTWEAE